MEGPCRLVCNMKKNSSSRVSKNLLLIMGFSEHGPPKILIKIGLHYAGRLLETGYLYLYLYETGYLYRRDGVVVRASAS